MAPTMASEGGGPPEAAGRAAMTEDGAGAAKAPSGGEARRCTY
jgi:hypothetical protein